MIYEYNINKEVLNRWIWLFWFILSNNILYNKILPSPKNNMKHNKNKEVCYVEVNISLLIFQPSSYVIILYQSYITLFKTKLRRGT